MWYIDRGDVTEIKKESWFKLMIKQIIAVLVAMTLSISLIFAPTLGDNHASASGKTTKTTEKMTNDELIKTIKPYVQLNKDGTIGFKKNVPEDVYEAYDLDVLQSHFDVVNEGVRNNMLTINKKLEISETIQVRAAATYGKWTYHWWGYDRNFSNYQTKQYIDRLEYQAIGASMATGVTYWFPPVGGLAALSGGYWLLLSKRVDANNNGNGVYVAVTWANVFNVKPL